MLVTPLLGVPFPASFQQSGTKVLKSSTKGAENALHNVVKDIGPNHTLVSDEPHIALT